MDDAAGHSFEAACSPGEWSESGNQSDDGRTQAAQPRASEARRTLSS
jgi:hypothetical protein